MFVNRDSGIENSDAGDAGRSLVLLMHD